ncbi:type II secretion system protein GspC [Parahaliea maris]|uniref:type II secretion system protein GspC n=1 Tax=Parahaliea maris TaxID=2716870 RepID=UPI001F469E07|nr:type II secretion system protein GspC [Parahaliea maris]
MPAQWLDNKSDVAERAAANLQQFGQTLAQPRNLKRLRTGLLLLALVWAAAALAQLFWALWPSPEADPAPAVVINPVSRSQQATQAVSVDREALVARPLFGEPGEEAVEVELAEATASSASEREGIEEGARETRLDLTLRGVVASTEDGLGHAIIEYRNQQAVYAVDDELPVSGNVRLAKVLPDKVVLDNNGTYELLPLFDDSELDRQLQNLPRTARQPGAAAAESRAITADAEAGELAAGYRDQLYDNPESLASLVRISAVREGGQLQGYRIMPGKDSAQFGQLGFKPGDLVTAVNGIALDNPANTMQLYQAMRTAREAVFDLQREGAPVSITVDLGAAGGER